MIFSSHFITLDGVLGSPEQCRRRPVAAAEELNSRGLTLMLPSSARLTRALLAAGLVDEVQFYLDPLALGDGVRLFDGERGQSRFTLADCGLASYVRAPVEESYQAFALNVLTVVDGRVKEVTTFSPALFGRFGLDAVRRQEPHYRVRSPHVRPTGKGGIGRATGSADIRQAGAVRQGCFRATGW